MEELFRMFSEAYRTSTSHAVRGAPPGAAAPGAAPWGALPGAAPLPSLFDWIRLQALLYEESRRIQNLLFDRLVAPTLRTAAYGPHGGRGEAGGAAELDPKGREIVDLLRRAQVLLLRYPIAAQAAFAALIAEGRRFATTPEGAAWKAALASSDLVRHGRRVWDAVSFNMLEDDPSTVIPSAYLEALLRAARAADIDGLLRLLSDVPPSKEGDRAAAR
jgi:hypothetical protein